MGKLDTIKRVRIYPDQNLHSFLKVLSYYFFSNVLGFVKLKVLLNRLIIIKISS
jgi:hypothetical protein